MSTKISKARLAALEAIQSVEKNQAFVRNTLETILRRNQLSVEDRKFASKLSLGVAQTMQTLDEVIYDCVDKKSDIKKNVLIPLRISAYEILYLEKEPHAAVDQGVELVGTVEPRAKGLANFVLHKIVNRQKKFPFGNPDEDKQAFCRMYSIPMWIYDYLQNDIGEEKTRMLTCSCNGQPPCYLFVNTLKTTVDEMFKMLEDLGSKPKTLPALCGANLKNCIGISRPGDLRNPAIKDAIEEGKLIIADAGSQGVCEFAFMNYEKESAPKNMLEICAGIGNKTIMLQNIIQQRTGQQASYVTIDNVEYKTNELIHRAKVCGINIDMALTGSALSLDAYNLGEFEHVFVDAPCSGLGTLRRHPELKWRLTPEMISALANQGLALLQEASKHVAVGGNLTYATCTVTTEENMSVINNFLQSPAGENFVLSKFAYKGSTRESYFSQTVSGLNDSHFAANLKKLQ